MNIDIFSNLYAHIRDRIESKVPSIKDVRIYNSQDLDPTARETFQSPSCFVEFNADFLSMGFEVQMAEIEVSVRVINEAYTLNHLESLALTNEVSWALQGYLGMQKVSYLSDIDWDGLQSNELIFEINLKDCPPIPTYSEVCGLDMQVGLTQGPDYDNQSGWATATTISYSGNCDASACTINPPVVVPTGCTTGSTWTYPSTDF